MCLLVSYHIIIIISIVYTLQVLVESKKNVCTLNWLERSTYIFAFTTTRKSVIAFLDKPPLVASGTRLDMSETFHSQW